MESIILIIIASLIFTGIVIRVKSIAAGRKGPGIFQPLRDIVRNMKKGAVYSETTGLIFRIAPSIYTGTLITAALCLPFGDRPGFISFQFDFVFFVYTLALGKFLMVISALDTGSSFEGMGASREAFYSMLIEPGMFMVMGSFAILTGKTSFVEMFAALHGTGISISVSYTMAGLSAILIMLMGMVENTRMPVDDPKTHLELTMIHEVMILDNSGFDLGLIMYSSCLKFAVFGAIAAGLFMKPGAGLITNAGIFFIVQIGYAIFVGLIESFMARFRMKKNPQFIYTITAATLLLFIGAVHVAGVAGGKMPW